MFDTDLLASLCIAENRSCWRKKAARLSSFIVVSQASDAAQLPCRTASENVSDLSSENVV